jgi:anthranilate phosphoribosyltransferase
VSGLRTDSAFDDPDRAYRALIDAHRGLTEEESAALNTRLVLILANHVGSLEVLAEAIALARRSLAEGAGR